MTTSTATKDGQTPLGIVGAGKTGVAQNMALAREMLEGTREFPPSSDGDMEEAARMRVAYADRAMPFASMPPTPEQETTTAGGPPLLFIDKLGERLQFERSGVRLYEALLSKFDAYGTFAGGPEREELAHALDEEREHFELLWNTFDELGLDPTAVTPSAAFHMTATHGIAKLLLDPRTNLVQCLEGALVIELSDNDCWDALIELAQNAGLTEVAERFREALTHENTHLENVRRWLAASQGRDTTRPSMKRAAMEADDVALAIAPAVATAAATARTTATSPPRKPVKASDRKKSGGRKPTDR